MAVADEVSEQIFGAEAAAAAPTQTGILALPFDQYQRYRIIQDVVEALRWQTPLRILDVGGSPATLTRFLPHDRVIVADIEDQGGLHVLANGLALPFGDEAFDIVITSDTLEHIPSADRARFLTELVRVATEAVIIGAPFDNPEVVQAEEVLQSLIWSRYGKGYHFLEEHRHFGLPNLTETAGFLRDQRFNTTVLPNGYLHRWLLALSTFFLLQWRFNDAALNERFNAYYNASFYKDDNREPSYRKAVVATRTLNVDGLRDKLCSGQPMTGTEALLHLQMLGSLTQLLTDGWSQRALTLQEQVAERQSAVKSLKAQLEEQTAWAKRVSHDVEQRDVVIRELQGQLKGLQQESEAARRSLVEQIQASASREAEKDHSVQLLSARVEERQTAFDALMGQLKEQTALILSKAEEVAQRDATIRELQATLKERTEWAVRSADAVAERDATIRNLQTALGEQSAELNRVGETAEQQRAEVRRLEFSLVEKDRAVEAFSAQASDQERSALAFRAQVKELQLAKRELESTADSLTKLVEERTAWAQRAVEDVKQRDQTIRDLQSLLKEQSAWARRASEEVKERNAAIDELRAMLAESDSRRRSSSDRSIGYRLLSPLYKILGPKPSGSGTAGREEVNKKGSSQTAAKLAAASLTQAGAASNSAGEKRTGASNKHARYHELSVRIKKVVRDELPANATLLVVSRGDSELLKHEGHVGAHFPQAEDGGYAGHYPATSLEAIEHLEGLRREGAHFLLFPQTAFWWLDYYGDFSEHLNTRYRRVWGDEDCIIYQLSDSDRANSNGHSAFADRAIEALTELDGRNSGPALPPHSSYDLICFPIIDWDFRFQRPQQLLTRFAADGHRIFYIRTTFHQSGATPLVQDIANNVFDLRLPGPVSLNIYRDEIDGRTLDELMRALDEFRIRAGISEAICVVDLPFWGPLALAARERWGWKIIYDCMDDHSGFSTNDSAMLHHEETLITGSDLVLATSRPLYEKTIHGSRRTLLLPNAADFEHFNRPPLSRPLADLPRPIVGYYGAISDWFDVEMIYGAAMSRPDWQFVLIGHTFGADLTLLRNLRNVYLLGEQPYSDLPGYLHDFDVACIPFLLTPLIQATNPVKFYEYLSAGKPVVSVELPELEPYRGYFYPAKTADDFVRQVETALQEDSEQKAEERIELARRNTWLDRHQKFAAEIPKLYGKASVIIVSFVNLEYLKLCLESLWEKTIYPNFEVIVVDNGSRPEIIEYLHESAQKEPRLKVILNGENLGFARGNNIGIESARDSEYIVLLNDDAVVTRGWLGKMIRYLEDERVGIVGPVTNWTGNEAKVEVDYEGIEGMDEFAERYTREHAGESFDIPMLAMYCVAFRRSLVEEIGPLDDRFGIGMFEDDDFSARVRQASYRVVCAEDIFVHHWGRASFGQMELPKYDRLFEENKKKFEEKWERRWHPHQYRRKQPSAQ